MADETRKTRPKPKLQAARTVVHRTRTWSVPSSLSFGPGLASIVRTRKGLAERVVSLASDVPFTVATTTVGGEAIQRQIGLLTGDNLESFRPREDAQQIAIEKLVSEGCKLIRRGRFSISMSGAAELVEKLIGDKLVVQARARRSPLRSTQMFASDFEPPLARDLFFAPTTSLSVPTKVSDAIDHLVFIPPPQYFIPNPNAPVAKFHTVNETKIRELLNVPDGYDGTGIRVALVDTGFYLHPYYSSRSLNYRPTPTISAPKPHIDSYGHGSAIAYNVFATAPAVELLGFQQTDPPQDAIEDAADAGADIISCSWGYNSEQVFPVLQASILSVLQEGKIVLFAAGNGHYAWPGSEPGVLSIGGVYWNEHNSLEASNYASGYMSSMFPNRRVPDFSGLCGQVPRAIYIMMPTQPGNTMDREIGGVSFPDGDETMRDDGWVGASGTSSATPQIAGVIALMLQKARGKGIALTTENIRELLAQSCRAVTAGRNAMGFPAVGQPNNAVGFGLVDAKAALALI